MNSFTFFSISNLTIIDSNLLYKPPTIINELKKSNKDSLNEFRLLSESKNVNPVELDKLPFKLNNFNLTNNFVLSNHF